MSNLFRGIPYSQDDKIHVYIQVSLVLGTRTKGNLAWRFACFCKFSKGAFCRKSLISTGRSDRLKPGKLLNLIGRTGNKT